MVRLKNWFSSNRKFFVVLSCVFAILLGAVVQPSAVAAVSGLTLDNVVPVRSVAWISHSGGGGTSSYPVNLVSSSAIWYVDCPVRYSPYYGYPVSAVVLEFSKPVTGPVTVAFSWTGCDNGDDGNIYLDGDLQPVFVYSAGLDIGEFSGQPKPEEGYTVTNVHQSYTTKYDNDANSPFPYSDRLCHWYVFDAVIPDGKFASGLWLYVGRNGIGYKSSLTSGTFRAACCLTFCSVWSTAGEQFSVDLSEITQLLTSISGKLDTQISLLQGYFSYVQQTLESIDMGVYDTVARLDSLYKLLYDYLNNAELSGKAQQAAESVQQQVDSEKYWNDKNQENFDSIDWDSFNFSNESPSLISGFQLVGSVFSRLWNALEGYNYIFVFCMTLAVALVVVGRIGRSQDSKRHSSNSRGNSHGDS